MKLTVTPFLAFGLALAFASLPARADVSFHVKNCSMFDLLFFTFDGEDTTRLAYHKKFELTHWEEGSAEPKSKKTSCNLGCALYEPWCHAHCRVAYRESKYVLSPSAKVPENHYIRFLGQPDVNHQYTISKHEEKCSDPVVNGKHLDGSITVKHFPLDKW